MGCSREPRSVVWATSLSLFSIRLKSRNPEAKTRRKPQRTFNLDQLSPEKEGREREKEKGEKWRGIGKWEIGCKLQIQRKRKGKSAPHLLQKVEGNLAYRRAPLAALCTAPKRRNRAALLGESHLNTLPSNPFRHFAISPLLTLSSIKFTSKEPAETVTVDVCSWALSLCFLFLV